MAPLTAAGDLPIGRVAPPFAHRSLLATSVSRDATGPSKGVMQPVSSTVLPFVGKVYLVGAGPGDPGLITARGADLLRRAEVLVYDRLANPGLIDLYSPASAERVYVGKSSSRHALAQEGINDLLVRRAREGKLVVRLHGGDPFVFGRGGEEALALAAAGIPFEVVPGITSAIAAPAYAGIPVTQRGHNTSFAVVTGHQDPSLGGRTPDWAKLSEAAGTLVILMGTENLRAIAATLVRHGRAPSTPVALIRWGTRPEQQVLVGTLSDIAERAAAAGFRPPAVTVVGSVVGLRERLRWWDNRPLSGKRVLVTGTSGRPESLLELMREQGAEPVEVSVLETDARGSHADLDAAIARLETYDWVVFTSAGGVRAVLDRLQALGRDVRAFGDARLVAIGPTTAAELRASGLRADDFPIPT